MKKALIGFLAVIGVLFLASCSSGAKEETKTFTMDQNGVSMELVFTYEGDKVKTQTANNVMPYSAIGVTTKEEAQTACLIRLQNSISKSKGWTIPSTIQIVKRLNH